MRRPPIQTKGPRAKLLFLERREEILAMLKQGHPMRSAFLKHGEGIGHETNFRRLARSVLKAELAEIRGVQQPQKGAEIKPPFEPDPPATKTPTVPEVGPKPRPPPLAGAKPRPVFELKTLSEDDF